MAIVDHVKADFAALDVNGDTYVCVKDVPVSVVTPNLASGWRYWYLWLHNSFGLPS